MKKLTAAEKKRVKELKTEVKGLETKLTHTKKLEGVDQYVEVKVRKSQGRAVRIKKKAAPDTFFGKYFMEITIRAELQDVFVPISIASGKKVAGLMYQIEGTAMGSMETATVEVDGDGISQVVVGTLRYAKIPAGKTATFEIRASLRGSSGKSYALVFTRLNYKLAVADARYQQYLKEIHSEKVVFG